MNLLGLATLTFLQAAMPGSATDPTVPSRCGDRDVLAEYLEGRFNETSLGAGLSINGYAVELFTSPEGTWTALMTVPGQDSCMIDAGEGWQTRVPPAIGDGI